MARWLLHRAQRDFDLMISDPVLISEWHPVARAADVPDGAVTAARLLGEDVVLWRSGGKVMGWQDLCLHRGAKLSLGRVVAGDCLQCPYHGWIYDAAGKCVKIPAHPSQVPPARAKTKAYAVREAYGWIWLSFGEKPAALPDFPEWGRAGIRNFSYGPVRVAAAGPRIIENFLDVSHLPIVHAGILGVASHAEIGRYTVTRSAGGVRAEDIEIFQPDPDGSGTDGTALYTYEVRHPLTAYLTKKAGKARFTMMITAAPVDEASSFAWILFSLEDTASSDAEAMEWMHRVFIQDVPIVESQRPEKLPLDLQAELHLNSDRTSIAYRQWLGEIGLTFGTA